MDASFYLKAWRAPSRLVGCSLEGVSCFEGEVAVFVHVHPDDDGFVYLFEVDSVHVEVVVGFGGS